MKLLLSFFPLNKKVKDIYYLVAVILVYLVLGWAAQFVGALTTWIPLLGWLFGLLIWVIRVYCFVGIVLAILKFCKVI